MKDNLSLIAKFADLIENFYSENPEQIYTRFFDLLHEILNFKFATIFLHNPKLKKIELVAQEGKSVDMIEAVEFEFGNGFSAWVAKEKRIVVLNNLKRNSNHIKSEIKSFMALPLLIENELVGVINFANNLPNAFSEYDHKQLHVIASMLAGILLKQRNYNEMQAQNIEIQRINEELKAAQKIAEKAQQKALLSAIIVGLNHEINNPLMIITGNLQMMANYSSDEEVLKRIAVVESQVERISKVMQKLREVEEPLLEKYIDSQSEDILKF